MKGLIFRDVLYGEINLPEWLYPFLRLPELVRLRGVRLSNVDSIQYKDFGTATRYDHALGVVHLAQIVAKRKHLSKSDTATLMLAALLHDVGTPPFGHTLELVLEDFDHELEAWKVLGFIGRDGRPLMGSAYYGQMPQFLSRCEAASKKWDFRLSPDAVIETITGAGELGYFMNGAIDLDNADNVIRGAHYLGLGVSGDLAESIAEWLADQVSPPVEVGPSSPSPVSDWWMVKNSYYRFFFNCSIEEAGRQAHLQFLAREAMRLGLPRESLIRATDEEFFTRIESFSSGLGTQSGDFLTQSLRRYRLLDSPIPISITDIEDKDVLKALREKSAIAWMESNLRRKGLTPALFMARRRYDETTYGQNSLIDDQEVIAQRGLFEAPLARLYLFGLSKPKTELHHQPEAPSDMSLGLVGERLVRAVGTSFSKHLSVWLVEQPWKTLTPRLEVSLRESLSSWGDWSFTTSRNENLHPYPSTFVHAIPSSLIRSLRLSSGTILDPYCGTAQTGIETLKLGGRAICSDVNEIGLLIARNRFIYHSPDARQQLKNLSREMICLATPTNPPAITDLNRWHDPRTVEELSIIKGFIDKIEDSSSKSFLNLCLSAVLTSTTARRGKQHGWFADNTPLPAGMTAPPYVDAINLFIEKARRNMHVLEQSYAWFERRGEDPQSAFERARVLRVNASKGSAASYDIPTGSVSGIVTSPPYLCMSDYSLGQRLSYYWLYPESMEEDFRDECGPRRKRFTPSAAYDQYMADMDGFVKLCQSTLERNGFVALVIGAPVAKAFVDRNVLSEVEGKFTASGFELLWEHWRQISWHRNHGYERLKREKIVVFVNKN